MKRTICTAASSSVMTNEAASDAPASAGFVIPPGAIDETAVAAAHARLRKRCERADALVAVRSFALEADASAGAFSADPVTGDHDEVVLEGHPVDLECAYEHGTLQLVQCRPVTILAPS